jgi:hypothetical protein
MDQLLLLLMDAHMAKSILSLRKGHRRALGCKLSLGGLDIRRSRFLAELPPPRRHELPVRLQGCKAALPIS